MPGFVISLNAAAPKRLAAVSEDGGRDPGGEGRRHDGAARDARGLPAAQEAGNGDRAGRGDPPGFSPGQPVTHLSRGS